MYKLITQIFSRHSWIPPKVGKRDYTDYFLPKNLCNLLLNLCNHINFILVFIFLILNSTCFAQAENRQDANYIFYKANTLYEENKYNEAIEEYGKLVRSGLESGNLYYNLGNCYFKKGELGRAVLNYERARLFIPNDSDLKSNYEYAKSLLEQRAQAAVFNKPWLIKISDKLSAEFDIDSLTIFLMLLYLALCLIFIGRMFRAGNKVLSLPLIVILIITFVFGALLLYNKLAHLGRDAVIVTEGLESRFEPRDNATAYFALNEGSKVNVIGAQNNWFKIKRDDGKAGWVNREAVELITKISD